MTVLRMSGGIPQTPSGGGCIAPPMSPWPSSKMSAFTVDGHRQRPADIRVIERRLVPVDNKVDADIGRPHLADRFGRLALHLLEKRYRHLVREGQVEFARLERQQRGRTVRDDRIFDSVKIGSPFFPVIWVAGDGDPLVRLEFDEFERAS